MGTLELVQSGHFSCKTDYLDFRLIVLLPSVLITGYKNINLMLACKCHRLYACKISCSTVRACASCVSIKQQDYQRHPAVAAGGIPQTPSSCLFFRMVSHWQLPTSGHCQGKTSGWLSAIDEGCWDHGFLCRESLLLCVCNVVLFFYNNKH